MVPSWIGAAEGGGAVGWVVVVIRWGGSMGAVGNLCCGQGEAGGVSTHPPSRTIWP